MEKTKSTETSTSSKRAVLIYSVALFLVVVVFIAISYFINERGQDKVDALHEQQTTALQRIDTLRSENERLQTELDNGAARVVELEGELAQAYLEWVEETKQIESKHVTAFDDLLSEYNELLAQHEALKAEMDTEENEI